MFSNEKKKFNFIISVPLLRNIRHSLSIPFTRELKKYGNIVIVSPFKLSDNDKSFLELNGVKYIKLNFKLTKTVKFFFQISDFARRAGYFTNSKDHGIPYYVENLKFKFNKSGLFEKYTDIVGLSIKVFSYIFKKKYIWKYFEKIIFLVFWSKFKGKGIFKKIDNVIYFQSCNWGLQDRLLSQLADKYNWKSIMIPYTSDQMHGNGYIIRDHNVYAVQSEYEKHLATNLHKITDSKIEVIGSIWHRNIEYLINKYSRNSLKTLEKKKIVYVGVNDFLFPRITEIKSVKLISKSFPEYNIDYCTYANSYAFKRLQSIFKDFKNVRLIPHLNSMTELNVDDKFSFKNDVISHLTKIQNIKICIMSYLTSMGTEANFVSKCQIIANFIDDYEILKKRNTKSFSRDGFGEMLIEVNTYDDLINSISSCLNLTITSKDKHPYEYWDSNIELSEAIKKVMIKIKK